MVCARSRTRSVSAIWVRGQGGVCYQGAPEEVQRNRQNVHWDGKYLVKYLYFVSPLGGIVYGDLDAARGVADVNEAAGLAPCAVHC